MHRNVQDRVTVTVTYQTLFYIFSGNFIPPILNDSIYQENYNDDEEFKKKRSRLLRKLIEFQTF